MGMGISQKLEERKDRADVSVVIPIYNSEETLPRAVDSIARQSLLPSEVLLIDDNSSDSSLDVCGNIEREYSKFFPIRVLAFKNNEGPSRARNRGWDSASGKYVAFLDADDSWHPEKIRVQWDFMENHSSVSLSGHLCGIHKTNTEEKGGVTAMKPIRMLLSNPFSTPTVMVRRSVPHRFSETKRFAEDYHLWMKMALSGLILARLEVELAVLHKPKFGAAGLSAAMWKMEKGEIDAYVSLAREKLIPFPVLCLLIPFSFAKYTRRLISVNLRQEVR